MDVGVFAATATSNQNADSTIIGTMLKSREVVGITLALESLQFQLQVFINFIIVLDKVVLVAILHLLVYEKWYGYIHGYIYSSK